MDQQQRQQQPSTATDVAGRPRFRLPSHEHRAEAPRRHSSNRETIESVVIAFVLAFLFRTFEAEAFVIPTGSMAPTLMGRHKEVTCSECDWTFTVGATEDQDRGALADSVCPNCRFANDIQDHLAFKGDRILVLKAIYDLPEWVPSFLREPKRWDVVVFKFPEEPQVNYIKRLVGLPDEELCIRYGNIYVRKLGEEEFQIARKPAEKQRVMRMLVYDNNHQSRTLRAKGWPARWETETGEPWHESDDGRSFESPATASDESDWSRISYHHRVYNWDTSVLSHLPPPPAQLITDFYGYNAGGDSQPHWVGDLALCVRADVVAAKGKLRLELAEAGERFACEFDLSAGTTRLLRVASDGMTEQVLTTNSRGIRRPGRYSICFGNTDDRLTVWLNDKLLFGDGYDYTGAGIEDAQRPTEVDLRPAAVAVQGTRVRLSDLVLYRDIYYTHSADGSGGGEYDFTFPANDAVTLADPTQWKPLAGARTSEFEPLGPDEFMMLGDNSPRSKDGRLWDKGARRWLDELPGQPGQSPAEVAREVGDKLGGVVVDAPTHVVHRQLLIGKAFFVYWPHGVPFKKWYWDTPPLGRFGSFRLPFYPNVARMKLIK